MVVPTIIDIVPSGVIPYGNKSKGVTFVQEWLNLHGFPVVIDGDYGPATYRALCDFRIAKVIDRGVLEKEKEITFSLWDALWMPMNVATNSRNAYQYLNQNPYWHNIVISIANRHLEVNARELGQNQGPWVRLYMGKDPVNGPDGAEYSWCGGFTRYCIYQALDSCFLSFDDFTLWAYKVGWSCSAVAKWAIDRNKLIIKPKGEIKPGSVFLVHRGDSGWAHTGFVLRHYVSEGVVETIEGNASSDPKEYNGNAVVRKYRSTKNLHFIVDYSGVTNTLTPGEDTNLVRRVINEVK